MQWYFYLLEYYLVRSVRRRHGLNWFNKAKLNISRSFSVDLEAIFEQAYIAKCAVYYTHMDCLTMYFMHSSN